MPTCSQEYHIDTLNINNVLALLGGTQTLRSAFFLGNMTQATIGLQWKHRKSMRYSLVQKQSSQRKQSVECLDSPPIPTFIVCT